MDIPLRHNGWSLSIPSVGPNERAIRTHQNWHSGEDYHPNPPPPRTIPALDLDTWPRPNRYAPSLLRVIGSDRRISIVSPSWVDVVVVAIAMVRGGDIRVRTALDRSLRIVVASVE